MSEKDEMQALRQANAQLRAQLNASQRDAITARCPRCAGDPRHAHADGCWQNTYWGGGQ